MLQVITHGTEIADCGYIMNAASYYTRHRDCGLRLHKCNALTWDQSWKLVWEYMDKSLSIFPWEALGRPTASVAGSQGFSGASGDPTHRIPMASLRPSGGIPIGSPWDAWEAPGDPMGPPREPKVSQGTSVWPPWGLKGIPWHPRGPGGLGEV